jgi:hypothetical protein
VSNTRTASPWGDPPAAYKGTPAVNRRRPETNFHRVFRVSRATIGLIVIALGLGLALAAGLGALVWVIATAVHHAAQS